MITRVGDPIYTPAGSSAVGRTYNDKLSEIVSVSDRTTFSAAIAELGSTKCDLLVTSNHTISSDLTIPANITLKPRGAILTVAAGVTLTINGKIDSPDNVQIFAYASATAKVNVDSSAQWYVSVGWFGAVGDGATDDALPIQRTIDCAIRSARTKDVLFPSAVYSTDSTIVIKPISGSSDFPAVRLRGSIRCYVGSDQATYSEIAPTFDNNPAIWVIIGRSVEIQDLVIRGPNAGNVFDIDIGDKTAFEALGRTDQYSPQAGIVFDGMATDVPIGNRYTGSDAYGNLLSSFYTDNGGSAGCAVRRCQIYGMVAGVALAPGGSSGGNTSELFFEDVLMQKCMYGISHGASQSRSVRYLRPMFNSVWCAYSAQAHGSGVRANAASLINPSFTGCCWLFEPDPAGGDMAIVGGYGESLYGIGVLGTGDLPRSNSFNFTGCYFSFSRDTARKQVDATVWANSAVNFVGCTFTTTELCKYYGPRLTFMGCTFCGTGTHYFNNLPSMRFVNCQMEDPFGPNGPSSGLSRIDSDVVDPTEGNAIVARARMSCDAYPRGMVSSWAENGYLQFGSLTGSITANANGSGSATATASDNFYAGDVLISTNTNTGLVVVNQTGLQSANWPIAKVASVSGTTLTLTDVSTFVTSTTYTASAALMMRYISTSKGDISFGSAAISNVTNISTWRVGMFVRLGSDFNSYRIKTVGASSLTLDSSIVNLGSPSGVPLNSATLAPRVRWQRATSDAIPPTSGLYLSGDTWMRLAPSAAQATGVACVQSGDASDATSNGATWREIDPVESAASSTPKQIYTQQNFGGF